MSEETISGTIEEVRFHEDGFLIARLDSGVNVKGHLLWIEKGVVYHFNGYWEIHPRYGKGFKFEDYRVESPTSIKAIREYLAENAEGIGPKLAEKLTDAFGEKTLDVLKSDPQRISQTIPGLTDEKALKISADLREIETRENLCLVLKDILSGTRIPKSAFHAIIKLWGEEAPERIRNNPYLLIDNIDRVGFSIADAVAKNVGFHPAGYPRIRAGVSYTLRRASQEAGHVFLPIKLLIQFASELLTVKPELIESAIPKLIEDGTVIIEEERVYLPSLFDDESSVAWKVNHLLEEK